jgi:hypothetical protein
MSNPNQDALSVVAEALLSLTYSEMMELGTSLADIYTGADRFDTADRDDWATLLHSWAENYGDAENV